MTRVLEYNFVVGREGCLISATSIYKPYWRGGCLIKVLNTSISPKLDNWPIIEHGI